MKKLGNHFNEQLLKTDLQKIRAGQDLETFIGPVENPYYSDVHYDNDGDGVWSQGDALSVKKLRNIE